VAHLVLEHFVGPRPDGMVVLHADNDSANNALPNLSWGTPQNNAAQMAMECRGGMQILGPAGVAEVRQRRLNGERGVDLAREFGISQQRVCDIHHGRTTL
jgi:hypothetical protein